MNFNKLLLLLLLIILFQFSCDSVINSHPNDQKISTICILRPHLENQRVFIYETTKSIPDSLSSNFGAKSAAQYFLKTAQVKILYRNSSLPLHLQKDTFRTKEIRYFTNQNLKINKGNKYFIEIKYDSRKISGQTYIPEQINITYPNDSTFLKTKFLNIKWDRTTNAKNYIIKTKPPSLLVNNMTDTMKFNGPTYKTSALEKEIDLSKITSLNIDLSNYKFLNDTLRYQIKVMAIDTNLYKHFKGAKRAGLDTGYGVFGSAVMDSINVFLPKKNLHQ